MLNFKPGKCANNNEHNKGNLFDDEGADDGGYPNPTGNGNNNNSDPCASAKNLVQDLRQRIDNDSKYLIPCDSLNLLQIAAYQSYGDMYQQVAQYTAPQFVVDHIKTLQNASNIDLDIPDFSIQNLSGAFGPVVNSDFFPVQITQMPPGMTPASLTEYFKIHINNFITGSTTFTPYKDVNNDETQLFNQPGMGSLGALVHIHLLDDGTVVESDYKSSSSAASFKFTTMTSRLDNMHPVSGNREFGVYADPLRPGQFTFYTMGVDRTSNFYTYVGNAFGFGFASADALWTDMQNQMINYINQQGGNAQFYTTKSITILGLSFLGGLIFYNTYKYIFGNQYGPNRYLDNVKGVFFALLFVYLLNIFFYSLWNSAKRKPFINRSLSALILSVLMWIILSLSTWGFDIIGTLMIFLSIAIPSFILNFAMENAENILADTENK